MATAKTALRIKVGDPEPEKGYCRGVIAFDDGTVDTPISTARPATDMHDEWQSGERQYDLPPGARVSYQSGHGYS